MFDIDAYRDELACRDSEWLERELEHLRVLARVVHAKQLAVIAELDRRGRLAPTLAATEGISERAAREMLETARALEDLPAIAAAAAEGRLSAEQLASVVQLADHESDAEWAERGPNVSAVELACRARQQSKPTAADGRARREARELRMWWRADTQMLAIRGELPDLDGALVETVFDRLCDRMRPPKGRPWDSRAHRMADALVELCRREQDRVSGGTTTTRDPVSVRLVVHVPQRGPAEIAGIPLPDAMVEALRASATIEPVLVDDDDVPLEVGRAEAAISPKIQRAVLLRDGHCRWPGCHRRDHLQVHHLVPRSWGGTDEIANLAAVCVGGGTDHHPLLAPQGEWILVGNPNRPDGLQLLRVDEWRARQHLEQPRAGPHAA